TLDKASRRISLLYQNIIFKYTDEDGEWIDGADRETQDDNGMVTLATQPSKKSINTTNPPSFLLTSRSQPQTTYGTQDTAYSDENTSVARFHTSSSACTLLSLFRLFITLSICKMKCDKRTRTRSTSLLLSSQSRAPDTVKVKSGPCAGQESSILKLVLGDEEGCVCQLTAWRDTAEVWGRYGIDPEAPPALARGDVVCFESKYLATSSPHDSRFKPGPSTTVATTTKPPPPDVTLTGSPSLRPPSRTQTCYRTLPTIRTDARLRLDRALGCGDVAVRRIRVLVR
ncbi:hypothetical protein F5141DRAFT_1007844, partial [Pisolithus sp. B1]